MVIGITGAFGLLGWHVSSYLHGIPKLELRRGDRSTFESKETLERFVRGCDMVLHLAGMNRGDEQEVARVNVELATQLTQALEATHTPAHLVFSSSTHIERDTPYGASKRECAKVFEDWAARNQTNGGKFCNLVLPNIFGEGGKPFYNSVVSTFCHQLAHSETPTVNGDAPLEQIHTLEVAALIWGILERGTVGEIRAQGRKITVLELLSKLQGFQMGYSSGIIPDVRDPFDRDLFNTYRSYLYPAHYPRALQLHTDPRGSLFEAIKSHNGGQSFFSSTHTGITRGNHYHHNKIERFLVVGGEAEISIRKVLSDEVQIFRVSGSSPAFIDIPTLHTHNIRNVGEGELTTLFWTHELFDPQNPDTYAELV
jgi:UDP-2-acetamido-2,6-beta-L-arabino-hexul-4-ose reductase